MSMVTRNMGLNMVKAVMDLNLASNLKYLFSLIKTLLREVLNLKLEVRSNMVTSDIKWLRRGVGVTNIVRFMSMFFMNKIYWARFHNSFFQIKGNLKFNILYVMFLLCL